MCWLLFRAGGRIPLIIGRGLTTKAREALGPAQRRIPSGKDVAESSRGYCWRRKWLAAPAACRCSGAYCEPKMTSVGSQDTTGPMTRDELKDLACLGFHRRSGDAVLLPHRGLSEAG
jgi:aconitate hydratase 2/2-methylisocitrate dehydratase